MKDSAHEGERRLRQAKHDLDFGRLALREGYFGQACFIAQQSAEKALKAVAYALGDRVVLGHSLVELVQRLEERVPAVGHLATLAGILDQYYVPTRYPNGLPAAYLSRRSVGSRRARRSRTPRSSWIWRGRGSRDRRREVEARASGAPPRNSRRRCEEIRPDLTAVHGDPRQ